MTSQLSTLLTMFRSTYQYFNIAYTCRSVPAQCQGPLAFAAEPRFAGPRYTGRLPILSNRLCPSIFGDRQGVVVYQQTGHQRLVFRTGISPAHSCKLSCMMRTKTRSSATTSEQQEPRIPHLASRKGRQATLGDMECWVLNDACRVVANSTAQSKPSIPRRRI